MSHTPGSKSLTLNIWFDILINIVAKVPGNHERRVKVLSKMLRES